MGVAGVLGDVVLVMPLEEPGEYTGGTETGSGAAICSDRVYGAVSGYLDACGPGYRPQERSVVAGFGSAVEEVDYRVFPDDLDEPGLDTAAVVSGTLYVVHPDDYTAGELPEGMTVGDPGGVSAVAPGGTGDDRELPDVLVDDDIVLAGRYAQA